MENLLDVKVSLFKSCEASKTPIDEISLYEFLCGETFRKTHRPSVDNYRIAKDEEKGNLKKSIPAITVSGTFRTRNLDGLIAHTGLMCIDIDGKHNTDVAGFDHLTELIKAIPYIAYCGKSVGGKGYFVIIPIAYPEKHKEHFEALRQDFARCGVIIDDSGKDVTRLRIYSYDEEAYVNTFATVYERTASLNTKSALPKITGTVSRVKINTSRKVASIIVAIIRREIDLTDYYPDWFELCCALINEYGESGRVLFHLISQNYHPYEPEKVDRQFNAALEKGGYGYSIGTFFHKLKDTGLMAVADFPDTP